MIVFQYLFAKPDELLALVLTTHANMGIFQPKAKRVGKPAIGIVFAHDPALPDTVELPVCLDSEVPQIAVRRYAQRSICPGMRPDISVTLRVFGADIKLTVAIRIMIDLRRWSENHNRTAVRTA